MFSFKIGPICEWKDTRGKYSTIINFIPSLIPTLPITVVMRTKASVCGCPFAGTAGSNPAGAWLILLWVSSGQVEVPASALSLIQRRPTECDVSECDNEASTMKRPGHWGLWSQGQKNTSTSNVIEQRTALRVCHVSNKDYLTCID